MKTEPDQSSVDYNVVLADLEAQRVELDSAIAFVKRQLGQAVAAPSAVPAAPAAPAAGHGGPGPGHGSSMRTNLTPTTFFGMSIGDAAKLYLSMVKELKTLPQIADALLSHGIKTTAKNFQTTVLAAIDRRTEEFIRPKRGQWGLKEWYPGARIKQKPNGDEEKGKPTEILKHEHKGKKPKKSSDSSTAL